MKNKRILTLMAAAVLIAAILLTGCTGVPTANQPALSTSAAAANPQISTVPGSALVDIEGKEIIANKLTVSATGSVKLMPDVAYVDVGVTTQNKNVKKAQSDNKDAMNTLFTALENGGLTKDDIRTISYSVDPLYDYSTGNGIINGYQVVNMVELTVKNIDAVGDYIDIATAAGANTNFSIAFDLLEKDASYNEALSDAMKIAKSKADSLASAGGYTIRGTLEVTEGANSFPMPMFDSAKSAAGAPTPISSGQMEITASITVVYQIN